MSATRKTAERLNTLIVRTNPTILGTGRCRTSRSLWVTSHIRVGTSRLPWTTLSNTPLTENQYKQEAAPSKRNRTATCWTKNTHNGRQCEYNKQEHQIDVDHDMADPTSPQRMIALHVPWKFSWNLSRTWAGSPRNRPRRAPRQKPGVT